MVTRASEVSRASTDSVLVDVNTGPAASHTGLRAGIDALRAEGADFTGLAAGHPSEWAEPLPAETAPGTAPLEEIALAPSERRLHRESEQVYRVLTVAATALCTGTAQLGRPLLLSGMGGTDLSSLRGFMRAVEHAQLVEGAELLLDAPTSVREPVGRYADYRGERVRCLRRMGLPVTEGDLAVDLGTAPDAGFEPVSEEGELFLRARDSEGSAVDRVAAALAYCRRAFFSTNWEGMAVVADEAIGLLAGIPESGIPGLLAEAEREEEPRPRHRVRDGDPARHRRRTRFPAQGARHPGGLPRDQDTALACFRAIREDAAGLSPELRAQSHLYSALTLSKRKNRLAEAVAEVEQGFEVVGERPGEAESVRRERGWLHNLRGLTLFAERRLGAAFEHEKQALACMAGLTDASAAHLRINLYSNISVLQEKAGKHASALATWEKFKQAAGSSNAGFRKHHAYRSAGLRLLVGERDAALADLDTTLENAAEPR